MQKGKNFDPHRKYVLKMTPQVQTRPVPISDRDYHKGLEAKLALKMREIVEFQAITRSDSEILYGKIAHVCSVKAGMTNDHKETFSALQNVFPLNNLADFLKQTRMEKKARVAELAALVAGVRIFNWDNSGDDKKANLDNLPELISNHLEVTLTNMDAMRSYLTDKITTFTLTLDKLIYTSEGDEMMTEADKDKVKFGLVNLRQFEVYFTLIHNDIRECSARVDLLDQNLLAHLKAIKRIVALKQAIPTQEVFPLFIAVSKVWCGFQEEMLYLARFSSLNQLLHKYTNCLRKVKLPPILGGGERLEDDLEGQSEKVDTSGFNKEVKYHHHQSMKAKAKKVKELSGFCPVAFVSGQGFLKPGNPGLTLEYRGQYFLCSNSDRAEKFGRNPDFFTDSIRTIIRENPFFERLFMLEERSRSEVKVNKKAAEKGQQTPVHFIEGHRDEGYEWNEWEMRRKALRKAERAAEAASPASGSKMSQNSAVKVKFRTRSTQMVDSKATQTVSKKKSIVVGLTKDEKVEHVLLEDLLANI